MCTSVKLFSIQAPPVDASAVSSSYDEYWQQQQLTAYNSSSTAIEQQGWSRYEDDAGNPYWYVCMHAATATVHTVMCSV
jgi:hypothetical protein